ncbi:hypothetical protein ACLOJK_036611, partial [Asimina triloba]
MVKPLAPVGAPTSPAKYPQILGAPGYVSIEETDALRLMVDSAQGLLTLLAPSLYLQSQPIPNKLEVHRRLVFSPTSDSTGHVVNYNIHMELHTTSKGQKCRAFLATLDEQGKILFTSLAPGSIVSFKQLTKLFEARFNNQWQRPITAAQLMCILISVRQPRPLPKGGVASHTEAPQNSLTGVVP